MEIGQSVFLPLPSFEKLAYANLSQNSEDWVHDITKMLYEKLPFLAQFPTRVKLERVDPQSGFGYGSIQVGGVLGTAHHQGVRAPSDGHLPLQERMGAAV